MLATASPVDPTNFQLGLNQETVETIPYEKMILRCLGTNLALRELGEWEHCHLEKKDTSFSENVKNTQVRHTPGCSNVYFFFWSFIH